MWILATVAAAGVTISAIAVLVVFLIGGLSMPLPAIVAFTVGAVLTVAAVAAVGWALIARERSFAPSTESAETSAEKQRQLLDDVRHELKTPITIVRGHLEVMDENDPTDVSAIREIGMGELDRMTRLIGDIDLLAAVEGDEFSPTEVSVRHLTQRVAELVTVIPSHAWTVEQYADAVIRADRDRLLQAWLQLADNAAKYTPAGTPIEIGSAVHAGGVQLWVRDHGPGIPPALRHRVFQRFDRGAVKRTGGGSGLGLAIVDAIAKAHGGHCSVTDTPGGGATFTLEVPRGTGKSMPAPVRAGDVVMQREASG